MVHIYRDLPTLGSVTVKICRENYNKKKKERSDTDIGTYDSPTHSLADVTVPTLSPTPITITNTQERSRLLLYYCRMDRSTSSGVLFTYYPLSRTDSEGSCVLPDFLGNSIP